MFPNIDRMKRVFISPLVNRSVSGSYYAEIIMMSVFVHNALWTDVGGFSVVCTDLHLHAP